jgi:hypothetical protein
MPWTASEFKKKHFNKATSKQASIGARVANETLARTGDDKKAVIAGIMAIKNSKKSKKTGTK